jgi:hypothetical protein
MRPQSPKKSKVASAALWCSPLLNTTISHYKAFRVSSLAQQPRQFGDIRRNPPCLIFAEQQIGDPSARNTCSQILYGPIDPYRSAPRAPKGILRRAGFANEKYFVGKIAARRKRT